MSASAPVATSALAAAQKAQEQINECMGTGKSFRLEAGAGAGKTYSLIEALKWLIEKRGAELLRNKQQVACITYTNVACDEILSRIDRHPAVWVSTIHAFCWAAMSRFQPYLRAAVPTIEGWPERIAEAGIDIAGLPIEYDLGYPSVSSERVSLGHNDVIVLIAKLLAESKFRAVFAARFPVLFVDEYQDTNKAFAESLAAHVIGKPGSPLIGLFGDHWQKIYADGCGKVEHADLLGIDKGSNFRSAPPVVHFLNHLRPELPQAVKDPAMEGSVRIFHTNDWPGARRTDNHWQEDLPAAEAHQYFQKAVKILTADGWDLSDVKETKILMLTNVLLAKEQNYGSIPGIFRYPDSYLKKENPIIRFLAEVVEPMCDAFEEKRYGRMFEVLGGWRPVIQSHAEKKKWFDEVSALIQLRKTGTIGAVLDHLNATQSPRPPESVTNKLAALAQYLEEKAKRAAAKIEEKEEDKKRDLDELGALLNVQYAELSALRNYIDDRTPFSTKHGVKGQEFENVLVVFGRGWNHYNFNQMLEWYAKAPAADKAPTFTRNKNLFYVSCSRPKRRLVLLFTQKLSAVALAKLKEWAGEAAVVSLGASPAA